MTHSASRFPLFAIICRDRLVYLTLTEARDLHSSQSLSFRIIGKAYEADGTSRDVTEAEKQAIWAPRETRPIDPAAAFPKFEMYRADPLVPELMSLAELVHAYFRPARGQQGIRYGHNVVEADGTTRLRDRNDTRMIEEAVWAVKRRSFEGRLVPGRNVTPPKQPA